MNNTTTTNDRTFRKIAVTAITVAFGICILMIFAGCVVVTEPMPKPPMVLEKEDHSKWFVLPMDLSTIVVGDEVCIYRNHKWIYGKVIQRRDKHVYRIVGDFFVDKNNYAGKLIRLPSK